MNYFSIFLKVTAVLILIFDQKMVRAESHDLLFNAEELLSQVPTDFLGALILCDPFCEIISVKLDSSWTPPLESLRVTSTKVQLLSKYDPLFRVLYPEVLSSSSDSNEDSSRGLKTPNSSEDSTAGEGRLTSEKEEKEPNPPKVSFENGWRLPLRLQSESMSHETDSPIQADFKPANALFSSTLGFDYFRAKPLWLLRRWWQFELGFSNSILQGRSSLMDGQLLTLSEKMSYGILWNKLTKFRWGVRYLSHEKKFSLSRDMLSEFSFSEKIDFLGLAFHYRRFQIFYDYGVGFKLEEQQKYRGELTNFTGSKFSGRYCQIKKRLLGIDFTPCYFLSYFRTANTGKLVSELSATNTVTLKRQEVGFGIDLNFGEDFLR